MKYHATDQINRILRLQNEAALHISDAKALLKEADLLTAEVKIEYGTRFVVGSSPLKLEHKSREIEPGNRDWLVPDHDVRVIQ
jgi:hypothetical protein